MLPKLQNLDILIRLVFISKFLKDFKIIFGITREDKHGNLRECLVGVKSGEKTVGVVVWLGGERGEKTGGVWVFSPGAHQKSIFPNWGDYRRENKELAPCRFWTNIPQHTFWTFGLFGFFLFWHFSRRCLLLLSFIINFFLFFFWTLPLFFFFCLFSLQFCWFFFFSFSENSFGLIS